LDVEIRAHDQQLNLLTEASAPAIGDVLTAARIYLATALDLYDRAPPLIAVQLDRACATASYRDRGYGADYERSLSSKFSCSSGTFCSAGFAHDVIFIIVETAFGRRNCWTGLTVKSRSRAVTSMGWMLVAMNRSAHTEDPAR